MPLFPLFFLGRREAHFGAGYQRIITLDLERHQPDLRLFCRGARSE
jgi:hypothetical protein